MNGFLIIYGYLYYKLFRLYCRFFPESNPEYYANIAYSCFLFYIIIFVDVFLEKFFKSSLTRENGRIIIYFAGALLFIVNYFIFNHKDRYLKIEEYFDRKGNRTTSIIGYLIFLALVIVLIWFGAKVFMMGRPGADWQIPE